MSDEPTDQLIALFALTLYFLTDLTDGQGDRATLATHRRNVRHCPVRVHVGEVGALERLALLLATH